jgi:hypothetical protein
MNIIPPSCKTSVIITSITSMGSGKWEYVFENEHGTISALFDEDLDLVGQTVLVYHNGETYEIEY